MTYSIIKPPFTLKFREMKKPDLKAYFDWFFSALPERISSLESEARRDAASSSWRADFSPESLNPLGHWFVGQVEARAKTNEELNADQSRLTFPIDVPGEQLTNRTFSIAMDVGMYFGQTVLKNLTGTKWEQPLNDEKFADYGQPVITGLGTVPLNPVRIVVMLAYGIMRKKQGGDRLRELYYVWANMKKS